MYAYLPGRYLAISAQWLPNRSCSCSNNRFSSLVHTDLLISGFKQLTQLQNAHATILITVNCLYFDAVEFHNLFNIYAPCISATSTSTTVYIHWSYQTPETKGIANYDFSANAHDGLIARSDYQCGILVISMVWFVSSGIHTIWPNRERRRAWTIDDRRGCPVVRLTLSFRTWWYHLIPNNFRKHHWSRKSILRYGSINKS